MKVVIGIDEVGRGPLAGPVAVCAFRFTNPRGERAARLRRLADGVPLRDSKKLTRSQRELWYEEIRSWQKAGKCHFKVTMISARTIDKVGIAPAIRRALASALSAVAPDAEARILLDGGLKAPEEFRFQKTIIKGDEKEALIALASIAAKVTRDRHMFRLHKKYPAYDFESHVGYATKKHYARIKEHGLCDEHRRSFLKNSTVPVDSKK